MVSFKTDFGYPTKIIFFIENLHQTYFQQNIPAQNIITQCSKLLMNLDHYSRKVGIFRII